MCRCNKISVLFLIHDIRNCAIGTVGAIDVLFMCLEYDLNLFTPHSQQFAVCMRCVAFFLVFLFQMLVRVFFSFICTHDAVKLAFVHTTVRTFRGNQHWGRVSFYSNIPFIQNEPEAQTIGVIANTNLRSVVTLYNPFRRIQIDYNILCEWRTRYGLFLIFTSLFLSFNITKTQHAHWKCCRSARWLHFT